MAAGPPKRPFTAVDEMDAHDTVLSKPEMLDDLPVQRAPLRLPTDDEVGDSVATVALRNVPDLLSPDDIVPALRPDLRITRDRTNVFVVEDLQTGKALTLTESEVSLARMLNGRRHVSEIISTSSGLGIPATIGSLEQFIATLARNGFVGPARPESSAEHEAVAWPQRGQWPDDIRTLFQNGIRLLRMGRPADAASYFEAVLQEDRDNIEARELYAIAREQVQYQPPPPPPPRASWLGRIAIIGVAVVGCVVIAVVVFARNPPPPAPAPPLPPPTTPTPTAKPTAAAIAPPPDPTPAPAAATVRVEAPSAGEVKLLLTEPRAVHKGEKLFEIVRAGAHKSSTFVVAPKQGNASPRVKQGAFVQAGQLLAEIE